jgi:hypothetical protein
LDIVDIFDAATIQFRLDDVEKAAVQPLDQADRIQIALLHDITGPFRRNSVTAAEIAAGQ